MKNNIIEVQNIKVGVAEFNEKDYICISDIAKAKSGKSTSDDIIRNWLRNRLTLEFLGTQESIYNYEFNSVEFDGFRKSAGLHTFTLSVLEWCEKTNAIGIFAKRDKYGGTYAHKDIAFEKDGKSKDERFKLLSEIAKYQLEILNNADEIKLIDSNNK